MKRADFILILIIIMLLMTSSVVGAGTINWIAAGGSWDIADNWSTHKIPVPGDDVIVSGGSGSITVDLDVKIDTLTMGPSDGTMTLILNSGMFTLGVGCINDPSTALCWDKKDSGAVMDWYQAETYCAVKGASLPTIEELVLFATEGATGFPGNFGYLINGASYDLLPWLVARGYEYTGNAVYWSFTDAENPAETWDVSFSVGIVNYYSKYGARDVRCVKAGQ